MLDGFQSVNKNIEKQKQKTENPEITKNFQEKNPYSSQLTHAWIRTAG